MSVDGVIGSRVPLWLEAIEDVIDLLASHLDGQANPPSYERGIEIMAALDDLRDSVIVIQQQILLPPAGADTKMQTRAT